MSNKKNPQISNVIFMGRFWNNLHRLRS